MPSIFTVKITIAVGNAFFIFAAVLSVYDLQVSKIHSIISNYLAKCMWGLKQAFLNIKVFMQAFLDLKPYRLIFLPSKTKIFFFVFVGDQKSTE